MIGREKIPDRTGNVRLSRVLNLGSILPLLLIVDDREFTWAKIRSAYLSETFDRSVLWVCKKYPHLDKISNESTEKGHERVALTRDAMAVPLRLTMFYVYFLNAACRGSVSRRCHKYDTAFFSPPWNEKERNRPDPQQEPVGNEAQEVPGDNATSGTTQLDSATVKMSDADAVDGEGNPTALSFEYFRDQVNTIHTIATWQKFFQFVGVACPAKTKEGMAELLRSHVQNSHRRNYHQEGMDYSKIQARGTSKILAKGQQYNTSRDLKRVVFEDHWNFSGGVKYLDATCLLYRGSNLEHTVDWCRRRACESSVRHSGDIIRDENGTHTIHIDLMALPRSITTCVFVISAWGSATLRDIQSASVAFRDADASSSTTSEPLCVYKLDAHDKVSHLKSVIMCKLYRTCRADGGGWHILAIGDSNRGSSSNYGPIYDAVRKLL